MTNYIEPSYSKARSQPLIGTSAGAEQAGPFVPVAGRPFNITLSGAIAGTVTLLRSMDGGVTRLPLTVGGSAWGQFTAACNEPVWEETVVGASFYLSLPAAGISYRLEQ